MISTVEMAGLAGRLGAGTATIDDVCIAEKLVLALVQMLPPNGTIGIDPGVVWPARCARLRRKTHLGGRPATKGRIP